MAILLLLAADGEGDEFLMHETLAYDKITIALREYDTLRG